MKLDFVKLQGLGNDFIFIDDLSAKLTLSAQQVQRLCDRHFGIGADGVILVRPSQNSECSAYMHYINSDGSLSEMCGNGVRCFAKYLVDRGYVEKDRKYFIADTLAGPRPIWFETDDQEKLVTATVDMGEPGLAANAIPTTLQENAATPQGIPFIKETEIASPWGNFAFTCVSMGNPHAICFIDQWDMLPETLFVQKEQKSLETFILDTVGSFFENNPAFPEKANIEFAHVCEEGIKMRVFERGCGETLACGTGACATAVASCLTGRSGRKNTLYLRGGKLEILWNDENRIMMTGPAAEVYAGSVTLF